jgi:pimeloyl-ACP methyl ester carboxylesterase
VHLFDVLQRGLRHYLVARGVRSASVTVRGLTIHHYVTEGRGKTPLLLVHGLGGSAHSFAQVMLPLSAHFSKVVALDLPGHGFSPLPPGGPISLEEHLEVLCEFAATVLEAPAVVVGNSLGGALATMFAHRHAHRVAALVLVSPAGAQMPPEVWAKLLAAFDVKSAAHALALTRRLFHRPTWGAVLLSPALKRLYGSEVVRALIAESANPRHLEPELLQTLSMPVMLVWGKEEKLLPADGIHYFRAHLPPKARIVEVEGFGHIPQVERPEAFCRHLVEYTGSLGL